MSRRLSAWVLSFALTFLLIPAGAGAAVFSNATPIAIPGSGTAGPASPYPSTITATGLPGTVLEARVTFHFLLHYTAVDIDALLVGPGGQQSTLMSDVCDGLIPYQTYTWDDDGAAFPSSCIGGTYEPTDGGAIADNYPAPAPAAPRSAALSNFDGIAPNGLWQLFIQDDTISGPQPGEMTGGWTLELLTSAPGGQGEASSCGGKTAIAGVQVGTTGNDQFQGTAGDDLFIGLGGNDTAAGLGGSDLFCGNEGADILRGGAGKDKLIGGTGKDKLGGGTGKDQLFGQGGKDRLKGGNGNDVCKGGKAKDFPAGCEIEKSI